jgi:hypothetical protein
VVAQPSPGASAVPLEIEPVIGWRMWSIEWHGIGDPVLISPMRAHRWKPRQPNRAACIRHFGRQVPHQVCSCGMYAVSRVDRLPRAIGRIPSGSLGVVGSVAMWGRVVEHAMGYRGQLAYPQRIRLVCARCFLGGFDGVPTRIARGSANRAEPVCEAHAGPGGPSVDPGELQQRLLDSYAVDLLPLETLHEAGYRRGPSSSGRLAPQVRTEARQLTRTSSGPSLLALLFIAYLILRAIGFNGGPGAPGETAELVEPAPATVLPGDRHLPDQVELVPRLSARERRYRFGAVCGHRTGGRVEVMDCGRPGAELFGFYQSPAEPKIGCLRFESWYSRRPGFSVCWLDWDLAAGPVRVLRLLGVHLWDLA